MRCPRDKTVMVSSAPGVHRCPACGYSESRVDVALLDGRYAFVPTPAVVILPEDREAAQVVAPRPRRRPYVRRMPGEPFECRCCDTTLIRTSTNQKDCPACVETIPLVLRKSPGRIAVWNVRPSVHAIRAATHARALAGQKRRKVAA